ncbi:MAG TPA: fumarylacetoacetase [Candidatus Dormibacteraeota bacterium]|nr:fumarylacetoacetase [Candidatus Dormibacteraeota bacterium]
MKLNETHDPSRRSWVPSANRPESEFPIQNLPFGIFREGGIARGGVAIGDSIFDLAAALEIGLFSGDAEVAARAASGDSLNQLMALGPRPASILRWRISDLLRVDGPERGKVESNANRLMVPMSSVEMLLPARIGDFTDFVCSSFHAQRVVRKPLDSPLAPALCYMPVAYHGRSSSVRLSGEPVRRPHGQFKDADGVAQFGPSRALDFELEIGAFVGAGNPLGSPIPIELASSHIFGCCLLNDWSARDVQFWESMLGPFLSKSLSTTISPWVVTVDALAPFRAPIFSPPQPDLPRPLPYLDSKADRVEGGIGIELETFILTRAMRESRQKSARIVSTNFKYAYWSFAQMIAHHTSNGCNLQPGDLLGSGTVSGPTDESRACLLEHTQPLHLPNGETRQYLQDEDEIIFKARARHQEYVAIGFGECRARIVAAYGQTAAPLMDCQL